MFTRRLKLALLISAFVALTLVNAVPQQYNTELDIYEYFGGLSIAIEDVSGDGYRDLVAVNRNQETANNYVGYHY